MPKAGSWMMQSKGSMTSDTTGSLLPPSSRCDRALTGTTLNSVQGSFPDALICMSVVLINVLKYGHQATLHQTQRSFTAVSWFCTSCAASHTVLN
jgi:hypothetical protein